MSDSNKPTVVVDAEVVPWKAISNEMAQAYREAVFKDGTDAEFKVFLSMVYKTGLDPLARQIYAVKLQGKVNTIVSIDGLRLVAERSGKYAGQMGPQWCGEDGVWKDVWLSKGYPAAARVGILRRDFKEPCWGVATFKAYGRPSPTWDKMPDVMLAKCAEALGLRKAFPMELSGLYGEEEMDQAREVTHPPRKIEPPPVVESEPAAITHYDHNVPAHRVEISKLLKEKGVNDKETMSWVSRKCHGAPLGDLPQTALDWLSRFRAGEVN